MEKNIKEYITPPILLILFLLVLSLMIISPVLNMVILGAILAYAIRPLAFKIKSKIKFQSISILIAVILVLIPLILLIFYILSVIGGALNTMLATNNIDLNNGIAQFINILPSEISSNIDVETINSSLFGFLKDIGSVVLDSIISLASKLFSISIYLFVLFASTYYFIRDGQKCYEFIESFIPESSKEFFKTTSESIEDVLKSIFYGHFLTSLIIGIIAGIGYSLLGYSYGGFLGVITGIFQLIPIFGPWPIYWSLAIVDLISGNYVRVVFVILFGFFLSLSDMYIRPALSSHYADIHPLILLIGFLAGPLVYGFVGFILGPLILGITYAVLNNFRIELNKKKEE